jgi:hypothetical protein
MQSHEKPRMATEKARPCKAAMQNSWTDYSLFIPTGSGEGRKGMLYWICSLRG